MGYQVALSFEDGVTRFIECDADQTVADASYRSRINIPLDCRDGACGTCKALCESGDYDGGTYIEDALPDDEAARGYVLPCSMQPRSDLVLRIASTSAVAKTQAASYAGTVSAVDRLSPSTVSLTVETPDRDKLAFLPGQYVNIAVPGTDQSRSYSFSNSPEEKSLTFLVKITPGGAMSEYLTDRAKVGDEVTFTGPNGSFFLRESARPLLLLAGGTGLAPILAILRTLAEQGSERPVHLVYGVTTDDDLVELERLRELAARMPAFTWDYCVSAPDTAAANQGYVMSLIRDEHLHGGDVAVYLCGPPPMVEAVRQHFADTGVAPTGFYYEKFALAAPAEVAEPDAAPETPAADEEPAAAVTEPAAVVTEPAATAEPEPDTDRPEELLPAAEARALAGQVMLPGTRPAPLHAGATELEPHPDTARRLAGQHLFAAAGTGEPACLDSGAELVPNLDARAAAGQALFPAPDLEPLVAPQPAPEGTAPGAYEIGEEHPSVHESDALFEARAALELGALELTIGRLSSRELAGYRLLAESTVPYVDGERFTDAAAYTETNAAFHDYLFTRTGNEHLLQAYRALGVQGHMEETLRNATWCHPRCAQDHLDIVAAVEAGDRARARTLVAEHAERSKTTTRRAMDEKHAARRPAFVTPGRFAGKVVLVTGSAQGIGERAARRIAAEGGRLVLADRSPLVGEVAADLGHDGVPVATAVEDLESYAGARAMVRTALERFGRVDVLINNVGGAINFKPYTEFGEAEIVAEINRSLLATLFSCRAVLPSMTERGSGVIVNVSSAATRGIHRIPYSAAKGGINALTASLAFEYAGRGIRVVGTAPGGTEAPPRRVSRGTPEATTEQQRQWFQAHIDQTIETSLQHRYGTLDEQAAAITFLASAEASYVTGSVLPVAGGDQGL